MCVCVEHSGKSKQSVALKEPILLGLTPGMATIQSTFSSMVCVHFIAQPQSVVICDVRVWELNIHRRVTCGSTAVGHLISARMNGFDVTCYITHSHTHRV